MGNNTILQLDYVQNGKGVSLAERVADQINRMIVDRNLRSGDRLPNEFELAEQLNVSRGTIREAIKLLASRNVVEIRRGKGTFICNQAGMIDDPLGFAYMDNKVRLAREILEVRQHMEPWIAALAANNATESDLKRLTDACIAVEDKLKANKEHTAEDKAFHTCIAECTHNRVIPKLIPIILYSVDFFGSLYLEQNKSEKDLDEARKMTMMTHRRILDAICARKSEEAKIACYEHLFGNREILKAFEEQAEAETF